MNYEPNWKLKCVSHKLNFKTDTKHIWSPNDRGIGHSIKFKQPAKAKAFNPVTNVCCLCLTEKYFLMFKPEVANINSRSEFFSPVGISQSYFDVIQKGRSQDQMTNKAF